MGYYDTECEHDRNPDFCDSCKLATLRSELATVKAERDEAYIRGWNNGLETAARTFDNKAFTSTSYAKRIRGLKKQQLSTDTNAS
jgi:hypothetical protein